MGDVALISHDRFAAIIQCTFAVDSAFPALADFISFLDRGSVHSFLFRPLFLSGKIAPSAWLGVLTMVIAPSDELIVAQVDMML